MENLMNAKQARSRMVNFRKNIMQREILWACEQGKGHCYVDFQVTNGERKLLLAWGYAVQVATDLDQTSIYWHKKEAS